MSVFLVGGGDSGLGVVETPLRVLVFEAIFYYCCILVSIREWLRDCWVRGGGSWNLPLGFGRRKAAWDSFWELHKLSKKAVHAA